MPPTLSGPHRDARGPTVTNKNFPGYRLRVYTSRGRPTCPLVGVPTETLRLGLLALLPSSGTWHLRKRENLQPGKPTSRVSFLSLRLVTKSLETGDLGRSPKVSLGPRVERGACGVCRESDSSRSEDVGGCPVSLGLLRYGSNSVRSHNHVKVRKSTHR